MKIYKHKGEFVVRFPSNKDRLVRHQEKIESFRKEHDLKRTIFDHLVDEITEFSGSFSFLLTNTVFFAAWLILNTNIIPTIVPFDPFPFGLLTTIVSLEAIFLSIFVLLSQNRQAKVADLREETNLQVDLISEKEITKLIQMQAIIMKRLGIKIEGDEELEHMMDKVDTRRIKRELEKETEKKPVPLIPTQPNKSVNDVLRRISSIIEMF